MPRDATKKIGDANSHKQTKDHTYKIAQANRGKHRTKEQKQAISRALKVSWPNRPRTFTAVHRTNLSKALKGRQAWNKGSKITEDHKGKISKSLTKWWNNQKNKKRDQKNDNKY